MGTGKNRKCMTVRLLGDLLSNYPIIHRFPEHYPTRAVERAREYRQLFNSLPSQKAYDLSIFFDG